MGAMRLYASHWVSLWKGTMDCQSCAPGEEGGRVVGSGQASPRGLPCRVGRPEAGQMGRRVDISVSQRVGRGMMGMLEARVVGWERR